MAPGKYLNTWNAQSTRDEKSPPAIFFEGVYFHILSPPHRSYPFLFSELFGISNYCRNYFISHRKCRSNLKLQAGSRQTYHPRISILSFTPLVHFPHPPPPSSSSSCHPVDTNLDLPSFLKELLILLASCASSCARAMTTKKSPLNWFCDTSSYCWGNPKLKPAGKFWEFGVSS